MWLHGHEGIGLINLGKSTGEKGSGVTLGQSFNVETEESGRSVPLNHNARSELGLLPKDILYQWATMMLNTVTLTKT